MRKVQYRSGYEAKIREDLDRREVAYDYEKYKYSLWLKGLHHVCDKCGSKYTSKAVTYTPDFSFGAKLRVEAKGKLTARDRKLALAMKAQRPDVDYKMMFQRDNRLSKTSVTKYSDWATKNGIDYVIGTSVPQEWLK